MEELCYDPTPTSVGVKIGGDSYVLREASEGAAVVYRNSQVRAAKIKEKDDVRESTFGDIADSDALLVSMCLFRVGSGGSDGGKEVVVPLATIRAWPTRIVKALFKKVREMSDMEDDTAEALEKQIAHLTRRLAKLKGDDPKGESAPGGGT